jgi:drug/metabolite transporter (DMT)-like permease
VTVDEVRPPPSAYAGIAVAVVAVSLSSILIYWCDEDTSPLSIAAGRMMLSALLLAPFALTWGRAELLGLSRRDVLVMMGIGAVLAFHFATWIASLDMTTIASSVVLVTSHPVLVGLVGHFLFKERLSPLNALGIAMGLSGVLLLARGDSTLGSQTLLGDLLAWLGGVAAGVYILAGRRLRRRISVVTYAFLVYAACAVFLLAIVGVAREPLLTHRGREWGLFLLMALGPSILGHTVYNWALRHVPASVVSMSLLGEPVGSSLLALLIFAEAPPELALLGGAVILVGIVLASWGVRARQSASIPSVAAPERPN